MSKVHEYKGVRYELELREEIAKQFDYDPLEMANEIARLREVVRYFLDAPTMREDA